MWWIDLKLGKFGRPGIPKCCRHQNSPLMCCRYMPQLQKKVCTKSEIGATFVVFDTFATPTFLVPTKYEKTQFFKEL